MAFHILWRMRVSKTIIRDVVEGDVIPSYDILKARVLKQRGTITGAGGAMRYFLERVPGTEQKMELMTVTLDTKLVPAALFEMWFCIEGEWLLAGNGYLPTDIELYEDEESPFFF